MEEPQKAVDAVDGKSEILIKNKHRDHSGNADSQNKFGKQRFCIPRPGDQKPGEIGKCRTSEQQPYVHRVPIAIKIIACRQKPQIPELLGQQIIPRDHTGEK
jgi:hypothetical protein